MLFILLRGPRCGGGGVCLQAPGVEAGSVPHSARISDGCFQVPVSASSFGQ